MSEQDSSNAQATPPVAPPVTSSGPSLEELAAKVAELERAREGLIRDVQHERTKRQELEASRAVPPVSSPATQEDVTNDELYKVVAPVLERSPLAQRLKQQEAFMSQYYQEKALEELAARAGKSKAEIMADTVFQDKLVSTAKKWNLAGSAHEVALKAYDLMQLEDMKAKDVERVRAANVASAASMPKGTPPSKTETRREYSAAEFKALSSKEFDALSASGAFTKVGDTFVHVVRS